MEEATCYVFNSKRDRPVKRRRLNDDENGRVSDIEFSFERLWKPQNERIEVSLT